MLSTILATVVLVSTLSATAVLGQFTNPVTCYYCRDTFIPGNPNVNSNPYLHDGLDSGCGYPFNATGEGVIEVTCIGVCVTQVIYDGSGTNEVIRMCSLVEPDDGCYNTTNEMIPRKASCIETCDTHLCNSGMVEYVIDDGVATILPQFYSIFGLLLLALAVNYNKL